MNAPHTTSNRRPSLEHALRDAIRDPERQALILEATGWDRSMLSKITAGQTGITIDKLDAVCGALGHSLVTRRYLDAIATLCEVGASCECARSGMGECGRK
jgi:transcriptional regulator with XRE-family HTH domain